MPMQSLFIVAYELLLSLNHHFDFVEVVLVRQY